MRYVRPNSLTWWAGLLAMLTGIASLALPATGPLAELSRLPDERMAALRNCCGGKAETIVVTSAWPLSEAQREQLQQALTAVMGSSLPLRFEQDSALLAGLRISIGAWQLSANLQDELKSLAEFAHDAHYP